MIINSDSTIPIEQHFKISAGPGAGKTYWLVKHIQNVLQHSTRLSKTRKIACITYTNIGVESILKKLGTSSNQIEVSTIHSFLYKHILKPYCSFISDEYELNINKLDGHDDTFVNFGKVVQWITNHPKKDELIHPYTCKQLIRRQENKIALTNWLNSIYYKFDDNKSLIIEGNRAKAIFIANKDKVTRLSNKCLKILEFDLLEYKKSYWKEGIIDHNDVLFFSYQLIEKFPFILTVLRAKFPYFFIDEFQDTNPLQVELIKRIGEKETVIGIIGDRAQSIYEFQGAKPDQFTNFSLPQLKNYTMNDNRRSVNQIIDVLNYIRKDIQQNKFRNVNGDKPVIIVGECNESYNKAETLCNNMELYSLSRRNEYSNAMKEEFENIKIKENILDEFKAADSNSIRCEKIISCANAVELAQNGLYKEAMKKLKFLGKEVENLISRKRQIVNSLYLLINNYDLYKNDSLMVFYTLVKKKIDNSLSGFQKGKGPEMFYKTNKFKQLALCLKSEDDISKHRTIHKAKGDEFENVMLILKEEKHLDFLLKPDSNNEEHRIYYVALSRARDRLFINVPYLSKKNTDILKKLFKVHKV